MKPGNGIKSGRKIKQVEIDRRDNFCNPMAFMKWSWTYNRAVSEWCLIKTEKVIGIWQDHSVIIITDCRKVEMSRANVRRHFVWRNVAVSGCPHEFFYVRGRNLCYHVLQMDLQWQSASQYCRAMDSRAHLLVINDEQEQQEVARGLSANPSKYHKQRVTFDRAAMYGVFTI